MRFLLSVLLFITSAFVGTFALPQYRVYSPFRLADPPARTRYTVANLQRSHGSTLSEVIILFTNESDGRTVSECSAGSIDLQLVAQKGSSSLTKVCE
jgi:hypothetical protein